MLKTAIPSNFSKQSDLLSVLVTTHSEVEYNSRLSTQKLTENKLANFSTRSSG